MQAWMMALCAGIALGGFVPQLPPPWLVYLLLPLSLVLHVHRFTRLPAAWLGGLCWTLLWAQHTLQEIWPEERSGADVLVRGLVWGLPETTENGWRLRLLIDTWCVEVRDAGCSKVDRDEPSRLALISIYDALDTPLEPGQRWQLLLRLERPNGFSNPGGFAYDAWLLQQGIRVTGYVRASPNNRLLSEPAGRPWFSRLRFRLGSLMDEADGGLWLQAPLIKTLAIGDKSGISQEQWDLFAALGLNHLMVISGLHIGLVATVVYRLATLLLRLAPALCLYLTAPQLAALAAGLAATVYAGLAGFSLPALRALVMTVVCLLALLLQRQTASWHVFLLALLLVLAGDPLAPQTAGFWLSFVAVGILVSQAREVQGSRLQQAWAVLRLQCLLFVGMLPVMSLFFQQSSLAAPLVNIPAIPWIGLLVVPLVLVGLVLLPLHFDLGRWVLTFCDWLLQAFMDAAQRIVDWLPGSLLPVAPALPVLLLATATTLVMLSCRRPRWRLGSLVLTGLLFLLPRAARDPGSMKLVVLDVGQGLAVILDTGSERILYDSGPRFSADFEAGGDIIVPAMRRLGLGAPDVVVISHGDLDHAGGLAALEATWPGARYLGPDTTLFSPAVQAEDCRGQAWRSGAAALRFLHPVAAQQGSNDSSCVLLVELGDYAILLPGDISRRIELELLEREPGLRADLLLAPHHGSRSSSSWPFVKRLAPQLVVFSSGYRNRFGHPHPDIVERYAILGVQAWNTAESGALSFEISAVDGLLSLREHRRQQRRFWHLLPPRREPPSGSVAGTEVW